MKSLFLFTITLTTQKVCALSLPEYLKQVDQSHKGLQAAKFSIEASDLKAEEGEMSFATSVFGQAQYLSDEKQYSAPAQRGEKTEVTNASLGVSRLFEYGVATKLYYSATATNLYGVSPLYVPERSYTDAGPTLEVSIPLLKNRFAEDAKNAVELQKASAGLTKYSESLKRKGILYEAEATYWRLSLARESIRTMKENLNRAQKIAGITSNKVRNGLADDADYLQVKALVEVRKLELETSMQDEQAAVSAFNTLRGINDNRVDDNIDTISQDTLSSISAPAKSGDKEEVSLLKQNLEILKISKKLAEKKYGSSLDLFASSTLNGHDIKSEKAVNKSFQTTHPTYVVGIKFSTPLGGESASKYIEGVSKEEAATQMNLERKSFEVDREWTDLDRKLVEAKQKLKLAEDIRKVQLEKLETERKRQQTGRSVMFQVLSFETDYANAQLNVLRMKAEILSIIARMKMFGA